MPFIYQPKTIQQLRNTYSRRNGGWVNGFDSFDDFHNWYKEQQLVCHYCGLKESESQEILMTGILTSNRFPQNGIVGRAVSHPKV